MVTIYESSCQLVKEAGIAVVTIDNPPMNVLSSLSRRQLKEVVSQIYADPEVIVVILTGGRRASFYGRCRY